MNDALIVSLVALGTSFLSPLFTLAINKYHERKTKKQDFLLNHRRDAIESFIQSAGACSFARSDANLAAYSMARSRVFLYLPKDLWPLATSVNEGIDKFDQAAVTLALADLTKEIVKHDLLPEP